MSSIGSLRVPPAHKSALQWFCDLDDSRADALLNTLDGIGEFLSIGEVQSQFASAADTEDHAKPLVRAGLSLATQTKYHGWSTDRVAEGLATSPDLDVDADDIPRLTRRLARLVEAKAIATTARAADLQGDHERLFHDARVLSDIRPVFDLDLTGPPTGAVVNQELKIEYFEGDALKQIFIALDRQDLDRLKELVDRAIIKTDAIQALLRQAGMTYFDAEGGKE